MASLVKRGQEREMLKEENELWQSWELQGEHKEGRSARPGNEKYLVEGLFWPTLAREDRIC